MTRAQETYRKQLLARIHTNSVYLQMKSYEVWNEWLNLRFKVASCAELSIGELKLVLDILLGNAKDGVNFKPDYAGRNLISNKQIDKPRRSKKDKKEQADKKISPNQYLRMLELANALSMDEIALLKFAMKQTRQIFIRLLQLEKITMDDATKIITGLEKIAKFKRERE